MEIKSYWQKHNYTNKGFRISNKETPEAKVLEHGKNYTSTSLHFLYINLNLEQL